MKNDIVYKALYKRFTFLPELVSFTTQGKAEVSYKIGKWTRAPKELYDQGYGLCVFPSFILAWEFAYGHYSREHIVIAKAEARRRIDTIPTICDVWELTALRLVATPESRWPNGTAMYGSVKLIEIVYENGRKVGNTTGERQ